MPLDMNASDCKHAIEVAWHNYSWFVQYTGGRLIYIRQLSSGCTFNSNCSVRFIPGTQRSFFFILFLFGKLGIESYYNETCLFNL